MFVHPALLQNAFDMFKLQGTPDHIIRKRIVVMSTKWLTGVSGEGESNIPKELTNGLIDIGQLAGGPVSQPTEKKLKAAVRFDGGAGDETVYLCYSSGTTGTKADVQQLCIIHSHSIKESRKGWKPPIPMSMLS